MPAVETKDDLVAICDRDFAKLTVLLDGLTARDAGAPDAEGWSIKDVVAHRAHWVHLTMGWGRDGRQGLEPEIPAPGVKWNQLKRYNLDLKAAQSGLSWSEARTALRRAHWELMREIDQLDQAALYGSPMPGGNGKWTLGRYLEASGASHYRSAAKFVRARIKALKAAAENAPAAA